LCWKRRKTLDRELRNITWLKELEHFLRFCHLLCLLLKIFWCMLLSSFMCLFTNYFFEYLPIEKHYETLVTNLTRTSSFLSDLQLHVLGYSVVSLVYILLSYVLWKHRGRELKWPTWSRGTKVRENFLDEVISEVSIRWWADTCLAKSMAKDHSRQRVKHEQSILYVWETKAILS
jgi:hypothetical protein